MQKKYFCVGTKRLGFDSPLPYMTHSILIKKKRHAPGVIIHYFSTKPLEKRGANKKRKLIRLGKYGDTFLKGGALSYERKYKKKEQARKSRLQ